MLWGTLPALVAPGGRRPRRRRQGRVRRGPPGRERPPGSGRRLRPLRRQARPRRACLAADVLGRVHRGRRDGPDHERVLRRMEERRASCSATGRAGEAFVALSRLIDMHGILGSLRSSTRGRPLVAKADTAQAAQTAPRPRRAHAVRRRDLRAGEGGQEVHAEAGRPAREPGAGARERDRGADRAGRGVLGVELQA